MTGKGGVPGNRRSPRKNQAQEPVDPSVPCARNSRRVPATGTVTDILAMLPKSGDVEAGPVNGPEMVIDPTLAPVETPRRIYQSIADRDVMTARTLIRSSGIVEFLEALVTDAKVEAATKNKTGATKKGRPARVTIEALLVAMWLAANTNRPMLLTEFADILFHCIYPPMRKVLRVSDGVTKRGATLRKRARWNRSAAKVVGATFARMTAVIDPSDEIVTRANVLWADMKYRGLTDQQMMQLQAFLDWVCDQLLLVSYNTLPAEVRAMDKGDRCIDATPLKLPATGRTLDDPQASSMPHGSYYVREGDHNGDASPTKDQKGGRRNTKKKFWALDLHFLTVADTTPGLWQRVPGLVTSMTADRAAMDPAGNARRLFASEKNRGFTTGFLSGDGLYAKAEESTFQIPAREAGYKLLLPILDGDSGVQGSHASGMPMVNGQYACVEMPESLRTLVDDFRSKRIDQKTFAARVKALKKYEMVTKQKADERGIGERVGCRASNHSLTVKCAHKPESMKERLTLDRDGNMTDLRPTIVTIEQAAAMTEAPPTICQSQTVTLKPTDGGKYRQALPIGDEHTDTYNRSRQSHEGMNGFTKDDAREALGTPGRRRIRTKVGQQLIAAFLVAAANMRKVRSFLERAELDANDNYFVVRTERKGDHARTGLIPGTAPPEEQPAAA